MKNRVKIFVFFLSLHTLACAMTQKPSQVNEIFNKAVALIKRDIGSDLEDAEKLLESIKNVDPAAYPILAIIASTQYQVIPNTTQDEAVKNNALEKKIMRSKDAIKHGFAEFYESLGDTYEEIYRYDLAKEYYEKGLPYATEDKAIYLKLGNLLLMENDSAARKKAISYYKTAVDAGNKNAKYNLGIAYITGPDTNQMPKEAAKLFLEILQDPSSELYPSACNAIGLMYEWGLNGEINIKEAVKYFTMAANASPSTDPAEILIGKTHLARLILINKIPGDKQQAVKDLELYAEDGDDLALYLYSAILINQGDIENGIGLLARARAGENAPTFRLILLQLGLAYQDGWGGLREDKKEANRYFKAILDQTNNSFRSDYLARAYLYIMGLGVEKDEKKGFQLLHESKTKIDDVFLETYQLFPALKTLEEEYNRKQAEQLSALIEQEEQQKQKDAAKKQVKKGKGPATQPAKKKDEASKSETPDKKTSAGESSTSAASRLRQRSVWDVSKDDWNNFWAIEGDGSSVSEVNRSNNQIIIDDPERDEKLVVTVSKKPYRYFDDLRELKYDPRIDQRIAKDKITGEVGHTFAKILDYVIQCTGTLGQFAKAGSDEPRDQIIANVTRVDKKTGKKTPCKAEYTFYEKNGKPYLYHRLLRPIKK